MQSLFKIVNFLAGVLLLTACQPASQQPPIRIGTNVWPGYEPLYVAYDEGAFAGQAVDLIEYRAAGQVLNGLRKGTINMAAVTLDEAVRIAASGYPVEVIWLFNISHGADQLLARPGINSIAELKGKRIGVEHNALGAYLLQRFFQLNQLNPSDYQVVGLDLAAHSQAISKAELDAVMTFDPEKSKLQRLGAVTLFTSKQVPGEVMDVLLVSKKPGHAPTEAAISQFIRSYYQHFNRLQQQWQAYLPLLNRRLKLTPDELAQSYQQLQIPTVAQQLDILQQQAQLNTVIQQYQQVLLDIGMIDQPCQCGQLINTRYLETLR